MLTQEEWMGALNARHGKERQEKFSRAVVAVCGLGGLGSNVAIALARAGIGKLIHNSRGTIKSDAEYALQHTDRGLVFFNDKFSSFNK